MLLNKRIRHFNYGIKPSIFNKFTDNEKDSKIKEITFEVLNWIYRNDNSKIQLLGQIKKLIDKYGKRLIIKYKSKETNQYRIDLTFQIRPKDEMSKLIVGYTDKKYNDTSEGFLDILDYQDLYLLIDRLTLKDGLIVFHTKKSYLAELAAKKYENPPLGFEISKLTKNNSW